MSTMTASHLIRTRAPIDPQAVAAIVHHVGAELYGEWDRYGRVHGAVQPNNIAVSFTHGHVTGARLMGYVDPERSETVVRPAGTDPVLVHVSAALEKKYFAPEVLRGGAEDHLSDQFSLACTAVELLTGKRAVAGSTVSEILGNVMRGNFASLTAVQPLMRPVLARALAVDPTDRYRTAAAFAQALLQEALE